MTKQQKDFREYTTAHYRASTVVNKKVLNQIYNYLENPPKATPALGKLLKRIDKEKNG